MDADGRDSVEAKARALAEALAADPRTIALRDAQRRLRASPEDAALQQRYHETAQKIAALEDEGRPVEPPLKREASALGEQVRRSAVLQALLRAHAEFSAMMDGVSTTIAGAVDAAVGGPPPGPGD
jgi:cell fate (sporulation/competence/biofilm development) regulator YlbF (YheA/YmcA/DUF963 family)